MAEFTGTEPLRSEVDMLKQEIAVKDARFARLDPKRRPHYLSTERLKILLIRAMRGWSTEQVAQRFQVTVQTIIHWHRQAKLGLT